MDENTHISKYNEDTLLSETYNEPLTSVNIEKDDINHENILSEEKNPEQYRTLLYNSLTESTHANLSDSILALVSEIEWKKNLPDDIANKYQPIYDKICKDISYVPKISDILELSIPYTEKCELFEKVILLNNMPITVIEFYELKKYLNQVITKFKRFNITDEEYKKYKILEESLITIDKPKPIEYQILDLEISDYNKGYIYQHYKSLKSLGATNLQYGNKLKKWIEWVISIPTNIKPMQVCITDSSHDKMKYLFDVKNLLDKEIYGLENVKEKILFLLNTRIINSSAKGLNFALSGPPGVAKTSIINVLSKSINLPFFQINAAGMKDSSFLLGYNFTYEGSTPGAIVQALASMKCKNGIIYFDEFDKISTTDHGMEISKALLHITDFTQNHKFHDRYISEQIDIDLSSIWFIYSINNKNSINTTLRDRISIIEIEGYNADDKKIIMRKHLLPAALDNIKLDRDAIQIEDAAIDYLIDVAGDVSILENGKSGIRQLKYLIDDILMKINFLRTTDKISNADKEKYNLNLSFTIKNFKLPLLITKQVIIDLNIYKKK